MPLKPCRDCGTLISPSAEQCPKCGRPTGRRPDPLIFLYLGMIVAGAYLQPNVVTSATINQKSFAIFLIWIGTALTVYSLLLHLRQR